MFKQEIDSIRDALSLRVRKITYDGDVDGGGEYPQDRQINKAMRIRGWYAACIGEISKQERKAARNFCKAHPTRIHLSPFFKLHDRCFLLGEIRTKYAEIWYADDEIYHEFQTIMDSFSRENLLVFKGSMGDKIKTYLKERGINYLFVKGSLESALSMAGTDEDVVWIKLVC